jgi:hypothetical protein
LQLSGKDALHRGHLRQETRPRILAIDSSIDGREGVESAGIETAFRRTSCAD